MKKILLVGGDSFSDQNYSGNFTGPAFKKEKYITSWSVLLAERLDMELVCLAQSGAGNEQIYSSILDYISVRGSDNIGMVLAGWSKCERIDFERPGTNKWHNTRVSPKGNVHSWIRKSIRNFYSLQLLCEHFNIPLKQFQMISLFNDYITEYTSNDDYESVRLDCLNSISQSPQFDLIDKSTFIGWPIYKEEGGFVVADVTVHLNWKVYNKLANRIKDSTYYKAGRKANQKYVISDKDPHPNQEGHKLLSEFIYENL